MFDQLLAYPLFFPCLIPVAGECVRGKKKIPNHNNPPKKKPTKSPNQTIAERDASCSCLSYSEAFYI